MPSLFIVLRACLYAAVLLFSLICLSMAGHFASAFTSSELTSFVPFALFVCVISLLFMSALLGFSVIKQERNPISLKIELLSLGFVGIIWFSLGIFLATSNAQSADVECFASESNSSTMTVDDTTSALQTEQFHAMYHVLEAFSLLNAILVLFAFFTLLFFACRRKLEGDSHMWMGPVTAGVFLDYSKSAARSNPRKQNELPMPATLTEKPTRRGHSRHKSHNKEPSAKHSRSRTHGTADRYTRRAYQGGSGQSSLIGSNEFDNGEMHNPNRRPSR